MSLRCATGTLRCSVQPGSETTRLRLRQVSALIRLALRFSAPLQGFGGAVQRLAPSASRLGLPESAPEPISHPVEAGPSSADGGGRSGQTCLSRRRVVWTAAGVEQRRLSYWGQTPISLQCQGTAPEGRAKGSVNLGSDPKNFPDGGSPFFPLGFFGETKKGNSPAGARPGLAVKATKPKPTQKSIPHQLQDDPNPKRGPRPR